MPDEPPPIGPTIEQLIDEALLRRELPHELALLRADLVRQADEDLAELKERAVRAYGEIVLHEIEMLFIAGFPREKCFVPAYNNTAMRRQEIQEELLQNVGRIQGSLRRRLELLIEEAEDWQHPGAADGPP